MKKLFLFVSFFLVSPVFATDFDFDLIRTKEAPGFFMVRIFPGDDAPRFNLQPVFVKNYSSQEASFYEPFFPLILERGGKIIEKEEISGFLPVQDVRILFLGESSDSFPSFRFSSDSEEEKESFHLFLEEAFSPVLLRNISADFGGNIHDVFPTRIQDLTLDAPYFFVGKFDKPMKTRMEINAFSPDGEVRAVQALNLFDAQFSTDSLSGELPEIWETLWKKENSSPQTDISPKEEEAEKEENISVDPQKIFFEELSRFWEKDFFFIFLLVFLGLLFFVFFLRQLRKRIIEASDDFSLPDEESLLGFSEFDSSDHFDEIPQSIPFRIEKKSNENLSKFPDVPFSLDSRTPETPAFSKTEKKSIPSHTPESTSVSKHPRRIR